MVVSALLPPAAPAGAAAEGSAVVVSALWPPAAPAGAAAEGSAVGSDVGSDEGMFSRRCRAWRFVLTYL